MAFDSPISSFFSILPGRSFGGVLQPFSGYVTLSESTTDEIEITQQPVQQGASIADHAFRKPTGLALQVVFGSAGVVSSLLSGNPSRSLADTYQSLLALQNTFIPFTVSTVKRTYKNMLFSALGVTTDRKTENILSITAKFQEVIIVSVGIVLVPSSQLKNKGKNQGTQKVGPKQSQLSKLSEAFGPAVPK
jgi:hypothetical protein